MRSIPSQSKDKGKCDNILLQQTTAFPESNRIMVTHKCSGNKLNIKGNKDGLIV